MIKRTFTPHVLVHAVFFAIAAGALSGCASKGSNETGPLYQGGRTVDSLEMPPDLIAPRMGQAYQIPDTAQGRISARELGTVGAPGSQTVAPVASILPESTDVRLMRDGQTRWLQVAVSPERLWPQLREFWRSQNLALNRDEPLVGIMETEWAENRAGIPLGATQGLFARALGSIYDAGTRDRYHLRVERVDNGTELFLSHRGAVETAEAEGQAFRWVMSGSDPALEAEMLNRLLAFLTVGDTGSSPVRAAEEADFERSGRVDLVEREGQTVLVAWGEPDAMWRRLGLALDRTGLMVDEQNRRDGYYLVTFRPDIVDGAQRSGFFGRVFGGSRSDRRQNERYRVVLSADNRELTIIAQTVTGERLEPRDARFVLELIQPELR